MDCGVPFCQAGICFDGQRLGCPLHNLIPEWNDLLWSGNRERALSRLLKTNCFPEFTGRVCPALCERACVCGMIGAPVTVRDNELSIIEYASDNDLVVPQPPVSRSGKRIAVVGSGPAGLSAAFFLNRRGHSVVVFERDRFPGGLLTYGIPAMKLPKNIVRRRIALLDGTDPALSAAGKDVVVVGAGDSASDCIATALRQGCRSVLQLIRKPASRYGNRSDYAHEEAEAACGSDIRRLRLRYPICKPTIPALWPP